MSEINWRGVDLNLLLTFSAIMKFRNVSAASEHLNVGQPATSYNLKRLRKLLNDGLFERQGNVMVPTQRAVELSPKVEAVLSIVRDEILLPNKFDPAEFKGQVSIGLSDYAEQVFGPDLFDQLMQSAPHCKIQFKPVDNESVEQQLESGNVDVAIGVFRQQPENLSRMFLYRERHLCMFDGRILDVDNEISLEQYLATPQVIISANRELSTAVDDTLDKMGLQRNVVMGSTRFLTVRRLLSGRNLIAVMAEMVAKIEPVNEQITCCPPPIDIPDFDIDMLTRKRDLSHPQMEWLCGLVKQVIQQKVAQIRSES